jgi:hypothetical protein
MPTMLPVMLWIKFPLTDPLTGVSTIVNGALPTKVSSSIETMAALASCEKAQINPTTNAARLADR